VGKIEVRIGPGSAARCMVGDFVPTQVFLEITGLLPQHEPAAEHVVVGIHDVLVGDIRLRLSAHDYFLPALAGQTRFVFRWSLVSYRDACPLGKGRKGTTVGNRQHLGRASGGRRPSRATETWGGSPEGFTGAGIEKADGAGTSRHIPA